MRNGGIKFVCRDVALTVENSQSAVTSRYDAGEQVTFPVAHHDGNYVADEATLDRLEGEGRVAFRYAEEVNGSARNIAGILNDAGNVLGMMPHPERVIEARSEEHTSELQSLMRISYSVFCLKTQKNNHQGHFTVRTTHDHSTDPVPYLVK